MAGTFKKVFFIAGNHEYYRAEYNAAKQSMTEICQRWENVVFMDRTSVVELDHYRIIGATLWSEVGEKSVEAVSKGLSDYTAISILDNGKKRKITTDDTNSWHREDLEYIKEQINIAKQQNQVAIVLTHHAPLLKGTSSEEHENTPIQPAFATDLEYLMGEPIAIWCYGHTHYSSNQVSNGTRVISNQLGYFMKGERSSNFNADMIVTVSPDGSSTVE